MKLNFKLLLLLITLAVTLPASAQFNLKKAISGGAKAVKALTLTDAQMAAYVKESVDWMDKHNPVPMQLQVRGQCQPLRPWHGIP